MRELRAQMEALQIERQRESAEIGQQVAENQRMAAYLQNQIETQKAQEAANKAAVDARFEQCRAELQASHQARVMEEANKMYEAHRSGDSQMIASLQASNAGLHREESAVRLEVERLQQGAAMQREYAKQEVYLAESRVGTTVAERSLQMNAATEDRARAAEAKAAEMARKLEFAEHAQRLRAEQTEADNEKKIRDLNENWGRKMAQREKESENALAESRAQSVRHDELTAEAKTASLSEALRKPLQTFKEYIKAPTIGEMRLARGPGPNGGPPTSQQQNAGGSLPEPSARPEPKGPQANQGAAPPPNPPPGGGGDRPRATVSGAKRVRPKCYICVQDAIAECTECQRMACYQHYDTQALLCIECAAKAARKQRHIENKGGNHEANARAIANAIERVKTEGTGAASSKDGKPPGAVTPPRDPAKHLRDAGMGPERGRDELIMAEPVGMNFDCYQE